MTLEESADIIAFAESIKDKLPPPKKLNRPYDIEVATSA